MSQLEIVMYVGFILSAYSVIGNDVIQTLGTFLSSNEHRKWWVLWIFAASLLTIVLLYGWYVNGGDPTYGRLIGDPPLHSLDNPKYANPIDKEGFGWAYLLPPIVLLIITRFGIPVSTSFLILTFFHPKGLYDMVVKSMSGYLVAFGAAIVVYLFIAKKFEKRFIENPPSAKQKRVWTVLQWFSTGFLWSQWLIQDFANIYVYLPREVSPTTMAFTLVVFLVLLGYIFYSKGGAIQSIVKAKSNTMDLRSATIIDFCFAIILLFFKELNNVPMSTTWVFLGLLAGREIAVKYFAYGNVPNNTLKDLGKDLGKVFFGLAISIGLVFLISFLTGVPMSF
ncbi:hypothetical protein [uncultured Roseivirga sp.]|uniref:hypothetical protein n=1 Tax=uncultured Roseivirga sp. TaxID=543088 RepID=UPI000D794C83|nr:hypothetical protein [uncultured Roseivirga sp.]PWL30117.1 MAG: hypothetical protein DCO95_09810 [Roseivirga sp. XM-24bin3]